MIIIFFSLSSHPNIDLRTFSTFMKIKNHSAGVSKNNTCQFFGILRKSVPIMFEKGENYTK